MVTLLKRLVTKIEGLCALPAVRLARGSSAGPAIQRDVERWRQVLKLPDAWSHERSMAHLLGLYPEFRNLLQYRTRDDNPLVRAVAFRLRRPVATLLLDIGELGPGLFIQHGFATIISANRMGADCWVNQQVTVGHVYNRGCPSFGDRVTIAAGAVVIGPIEVGDDVTIGANTTVVKDVPSGSVVVGAPNRIIQRIDLQGSAGGEVDPRVICAAPRLAAAN